MKITLQPKGQQFFNYLGFEKLTAIQNLTYTKIMDNQDLIVQSATGSGKTHAFLFPLMDKIDSSKAYTQALIIAPTRELSMQLFNFASEMKVIDPNIKISLMIGGQDKTKSMIDSHLVIGTPGRLNDEFSSGMLFAQGTTTVVIDEADMIWEYGFMDDLAGVLSRISVQHQTLVFSATIPDQLKSYLRKVTKNPETIENKEKSEFNPKITNVLIEDVKQQPAKVILDIMSATQMSGCIIFCNTRKEAASLSQELSSYNLDVLELHGDLTARKRKQTINRLVSDQHFILVATDIAARGLDLPYVSHVISVGLPSHLEFYFHRAGRTGRASKEGTCYVLVDQSHRQDVLKLGSMGISFIYQRVKDNQLLDARNFYEKRTYHKKVDPEILAIVNRKDTKVKPNYKKKRRQAISKLHQKKRRQMIQEEISKQKKERAKARSKAKSERSL